MKNNYDLIELTENEMKEQNGGSFPMLIIMAFVSKDPFAVYKGIIDGYIRATKE